MATQRVQLAGSTETVEVTITEWYRSEGQGKGVLANGDIVTIFEGVHGSLVLSKQDSEKLKRK